MNMPKFERSNADEKIRIEIIAGVEGDCLSINDYRVCGPKPWGGGIVKKQWRVRRGDLLEYLRIALDFNHD